MVRIYLETEGTATPEYVFVSTLMNYWGIDTSLYDVVCVGGKDNIHNMANKMKETTLENGKNLVVFDADFPYNGGGFEKRRAELIVRLKEMEVDAEIFLFPNNRDDGDVEVLLDTLARKDIHSRFFDCFSDYESCLGNEYNSPDLKGKLYTYMTSQKGISNRKRNKIKSGQWHFSDENYWDISRVTLDPLKNFILAAF